MPLLPGYTGSWSRLSLRRFITPDSRRPGGGGMPVIGQIYPRPFADTNAKRSSD
jgi:hypothetical protein